MRKIKLIILLTPLIVNGQGNCTIYTDTLYYIGLRECTEVIFPCKLELEPNQGFVWVKNLDRFIIDTSSYEKMVTSFYTNSVWAANFFFEEISETVYSSPCMSSITKNEKEKLCKDGMYKDSFFCNAGAKYIYRYPYDIRLQNTKFYQDDFAINRDIDTITANVDVYISVCRMVISYLKVPFTYNEGYTTDLQFDKRNYPLKYRYKLIQIKEFLPIETPLLNFSPEYNSFK